MTGSNIDATTRGGLVELTDNELDQVSGGIIPVLVAAGAFIAANAEFFACAAAGAALVGGFWYCATHYQN